MENTWKLSRQNQKKVMKGLLMIVALSSIFIFSSHFYEFDALLQHTGEHDFILTYLVIAFLFALSFVVFYFSHALRLPSFVVAIFFGMAGQPILMTITDRHELLGVIVGLGATLILFGGGLETPFHNFKKLIGQILALSFPGLFCTAILFSWMVYDFSAMLTTPLSIPVAVLLGAVLASTDPAAIIPVLKKLRFKNRATKDIIISESAVTDVTGTLLTVVFLSLIQAQMALPGISAWYGAIFSSASGIILFKQLFYGVLFGILGYLLLEMLMKLKRRYDQEFEADSAFFLFVPIVIFTMAISFGGSGYLAAFVGGLLFNLTEHLSETGRFFNNLIDGFLKPTIFILLGALVDVHSLVSYAALGISVSLGFMLIIRPLIVFITLTPFHYFGKQRLSIREIFFISAVRETGAIPAVLMVTIASLGSLEIAGLIEVGMWVILMTLIIEPVLTPTIARRLRIAEPISDRDEGRLDLNGAPLVVLVSRGESFLDRLPYVVKWATTHRVRKVCVLLCLEDDYSVARDREVASLAQEAFAAMNASQSEQGLAEREFSFVSRTGFLQDNIERMARENPNVVAIFVGQRMLDYRLDEIKCLSVPLFFLK